HDVGGLDVAVDDGGTLVVQIGQDITERDADPGHLPQGKSTLGSACKQLFEGLSFDIVHDDVPVFGVGELVVDVGEVCVFQPGEQGDLAVEGVGALDLFLGGESGHVDRFDGDAVARPPPPITRLKTRAKTAY